MSALTSPLTPAMPRSDRVTPRGFRRDIQGLRAINGHHHEIYLSDARRTAPEKLKTILRQPVRPI